MGVCLFFAKFQKIRGNLVIHPINLFTIDLFFFSIFSSSNWLPASPSSSCIEKNSCVEDVKRFIGQTTSKMKKIQNRKKIFDLLASMN